MWPNYLLRLNTTSDLPSTPRDMHLQYTSMLQALGRIYLKTSVYWLYLMENYVELPWQQLDRIWLDPVSEHQFWRVGTSLNQTSKARQRHSSNMLTQTRLEKTWCMLTSQAPVTLWSLGTIRSWVTGSTGQIYSYFASSNVTLSF